MPLIVYVEKATITPAAATSANREADEVPAALSYEAVEEGLAELEGLVPLPLLLLLFPGVSE